MGELPGGFGSLAVAPNKQRWAIVRGFRPAEIVVGGFDGNKAIVLTSVSSYNQPGIPVWSPDSKILSVANQTGTIDVYRLNER